MPCTVTGSLEGDARLAAEENAEELAARLKSATQAACAAYHILKIARLDKLLDDDARSWFLQHVAQEQEHHRETGLAKLTPQEKSALGLKDA